MVPHSYSGEAVVLARRNYGEADRILSLYSKSLGRISLIAKGVRRLKSKKRGHVEIFGYIKFQAVSGHGLDIITEAEIINEFANIRKSLKKVSLAYYFMELMGKITHEGEPNTELFDLLVNSLNSLEKANKLRELRMYFIEQVLILMGYWPESKKMENPDQALEEVIERRMSSMRVGKRMLK